jgi:hypothetical protein
MASWVLTYKRCGEIFTYRGKSESLADYFFGAKPEFTPEGRV